MNRAMVFVFAPEAVLAALTGLVYLFCARHSSYSSADVSAVERMIWLCPVIAVVAAFATLWVPGSRTWWWLARLNLALVVGLVACAFLLAARLGKPGSGPHGEDGAVMIIVAFGVIFSAIGNAFAAAAILRAQRPGFDAWFQARPVLGPALTLLAAVPVGVVQGLVTTVVLTLALAIYAGLSR